MEVSLDTDITIHLYDAGKEELLFKYFDKCYIHEFILEHEIKNKSHEVYNKILEEIEKGRIIKVTQRYLIDIGMRKSFEDKVYEFKVLFDFGETNAVALASVLGIAALVTDDTKDQGPHDTLVKEYVENIIPFSFYELLYLDYLQTDDDYKSLKEDYETINRAAYPQYPMGFVGRIKRVVRRFGKFGSERDKKWMEAFCNDHKIDYRCKMQNLQLHLRDEQ